MPVTCERKKIMVAMSGGVDSTVCASVLKDAGHPVHCVYFVMSEAHFSGIGAAQRSCDELNLPLTVLDLRELFSREVIDPFCRDYCRGVTPNPCIACNPLVKFKSLIAAADEHHCEFAATGHYARLAKDRGSSPILKKAANKKRDQSYMLYRLPAVILSRLVFPLGEMTKDQVRGYALDRGISAHNQPDSQEICFVPDGDYPAFIHRQGFLGQPGVFLSPEGIPLLAHRGTEYYTIGQRRGLAVNLGKPVFIRRIHADGNIQLAYAGGEFAREIDIHHLIQNDAFTFQAGSRYDVKIRSAANPAACEIVNREEDRLTVRFRQPQRAPAPGQSAVLYDGDDVAGGGIIADFQDDVESAAFL